MYDGTDIALVLGGLLSAGLAGLSLSAAVIWLGIFAVRKWKQKTAASFTGKWPVFFVVAAFLCGLSIPSGLATYNLFEHQRGYSNPPAHIVAVAGASVWGPLAAGVFGCYWLRRNYGGGEKTSGSFIEHGK